MYYLLLPSIIFRHQLLVAEMLDDSSFIVPVIKIIIRVRIHSYYYLVILVAAKPGGVDIST